MEHELVASMVSAANFVLAMMSLVVCVYFAAIVRTGEISGYVLKLAIGISMVSGGLFLHRTYWMVQRALESASHPLAEHLYAHVSWLTLIPMAIVVVGYGHHLSRSLEDALGTDWRTPYYASILSIWLLAIWVQEAAK